MSMTATAKLTFSIWRDYEPPRPISFSSQDAPNRPVHTDGLFQEQIYSWSLREDAFSGVSDDKVRESLREKLVEQFSDDKPPSERKLNGLQRFIDLVDEALEAKQVDPVQSEDLESEHAEPGDSSQIEINSLLALAIHLKWVIACFSQLPGISVTVR